MSDRCHPIADTVIPLCCRGHTGPDRLPAPRAVTYGVIHMSAVLVFLSKEEEVLDLLAWGRTWLYTNRFTENAVCSCSLAARLWMEQTMSPGRLHLTGTGRLNWKNLWLEGDRDMLCLNVFIKVKK